MTTMKDRMKELQKPLDSSDIELRVGRFNGTSGFCTLLAYKTARVDAERLDKVFPGAWGNSFSRDEKGILSCTIKIWNDEIKAWVERTDVGVESQTEKDKGEASDAFKRAGFKWGIGAELYDLPKLDVNLKPDEFKVEKVNGKDVAKQTWKLHLDKWTLKKTDKGYVVTDELGNVRFSEKPQSKNKPDPEPEPETTTETKKPEYSKIDNDIIKAKKIAGLKNEDLIKMCDDNFKKVYADLTDLEKQSLFKLIEKEVNK